MGPKERAAMAESIGTSTGLETAILLQHDVHRDAHPSRSYTKDYIHYPRGTCKSICTYLHAYYIYIHKLVFAYLFCRLKMVSFYMSIHAYLQHQIHKPNAKRNNTHIYTYIYVYMHICKNKTI
jgi:hypothetical protein